MYKTTRICGNQNSSLTTQNDPMRCSIQNIFSCQQVVNEALMSTNSDTNEDKPVRMVRLGSDDISCMRRSTRESVPQTTAGESSTVMTFPADVISIWHWLYAHLVKCHLMSEVDYQTMPSFSIFICYLSGYFLGARPAALAHKISYWRTDIPTFGPLGAPGAHRSTFNWALMQFLHSLIRKLFVI